MELFTQAERAMLEENGRKVRATAGTAHEFKPLPVVKWFTPDGAATWLISEIDPDDPDVAWGVADLGFGDVEYGTISIPEIRTLRGKMGLPVERDRWFKAKADVYEYLLVGSDCGSLTKAMQRIG